MLWVAEDAVVGGGELQETSVAESGVRDYKVGYWGEMEEGN